MADSITSAEASEATGVPVATLNEWARRGIVETSLKKSKRGTARRWQRGDVARVVAIRAMRECGVPLSKATAAVDRLFEESDSALLENALFPLS